MRNIIKTYILFVALFASLMFTSCEKFLDTEPTDSINETKAINTLSDAEYHLNGILRQATLTNYYGRRMLFYADMKGGDFLVPSGGRGDDALWSFNHESSNNDYTGYWTTIYNVVFQANHLIKEVDAKVIPSLTSDKDKALAQHYKGQALFVRAMCFFDLVRMYGYPYMKDNGESLGIAIVTEPLLTKDEILSANFERSKVKDAYTQIVKDLNAALGLLKSKTELKTLLGSSTYMNYVNGFISKHSATSLLARVYLYQGSWNEAYAMAETVITSGEYSLYSNTEWVASWKSQFGKESIFEMVVTPDQNDQGNASPRSFLAPKYSSSSFMAAAVAGDDFLSSNGLGEDLSDVRWGVMYLDEYGDNYEFNQKPANVSKQKPNAVQNRKGWIRKYDGDGKSTANATNIKVIRLSEVYLIGAEAALKKSPQDKAQAAKWLQDIRKRSPGLPAASAADTDSNLENMILSEKRKELIGEGHRYFDQIRLGKTVTFDEPLFGDPTLPPAGRTNTVDWNFHKCVLPIGKDAINANPKLKSQQNPGYAN